MKQFTLAAALVAALGLVGCSGGSSSGPSEAQLKKELGSGPPSLKSLGEKMGKGMAAKKPGMTQPIQPPTGGN